MTDVAAPRGLLDAMLAMLQRDKANLYAVAVTGYQECSYNIGYCPTCSDVCTDVRIYFTHRDGSPWHWDFVSSRRRSGTSARSRTHPARPGTCGAATTAASCGG